MEESEDQTLIENVVEEPIEVSIKQHPKFAAIRLLFGGLAFYFAWFACVWGAASGRPLMGPLIVLGCIGVHLLLSHQVKKDVIVILSVALLGPLLDTAYLLMGMVSYTIPNRIVTFYSPLWLISLYALFAMTLDHSLAWLGKRPVLASILGAGGAVFSYKAGERMGAMQFLWPFPLPLVVLAVVWAILFPLMYRGSKALDRYL